MDGASKLVKAGIASSWFSFLNISAQSSAAFHVETSHLICTTNKLTGFCMKCNTELKWVNLKSVSINSLNAKAAII